MDFAAKIFATVLKLIGRIWMCRIPIVSNFQAHPTASPSFWLPLAIKKTLFWLYLTPVRNLLLRPLDSMIQKLDALYSPKFWSSKKEYLTKNLSLVGLARHALQSFYGLGCPEFPRYLSMFINYQLILVRYIMALLRTVDRERLEGADWTHLFYKKQKMAPWVLYLLFSNYF